MQRVRGYKFKFKSNAKFEAACNLTLDLCRELYNSALQERRDAYQINGVSLNYHAQAIQLPEIKEIRGEVGGVYSQVLQDVLRRVEKTYAGFFRRVKKGERPGYPRFKPASRYDSFTYPQNGFRLAGNKLHLSKIGSCRIHLSRLIEGTIKTCTIKREVDGWYVIFAVEENQCRFFPKTGERVGIDVGIENFATLSTGEATSNPEYLRESERELKTAQRRVARRSNRRSKRRGKAVKFLAKKHQKIARRRADFQHKTALKIVRKFDWIAVEDLKIKGMVKNHCLAKSISDAGWGKFIAILTSKAEGAGREVIKVNPSYTSQDCARCGARVRKTLAKRKHRCESCGFVAHRDINAARNIERRGALASGMVPDGELCEPRIPHYNAALGV
jgi:putative transposase